MKKILFILVIFLITNYSNVNANISDELFSSCSEQEVTTNYINSLIPKDKWEEIRTNIENKWFWKIISSWTHKIINWEGKTGELMYNDNWDYIAAVFDDNSTYRIIKNWEVIKEFDAGISSYVDEYWISSHPVVFLSKDSKHYAYSYKENDKKYFVNIDWINTCYETNTRNEYYFYPMNISFSNDWSKYMYSISFIYNKFDHRNVKTSTEIRSSIYINNKEVSSGGMLTINASLKSWIYLNAEVYEYCLNDTGLKYWEIQDLFFSPNWEKYAFTKYSICKGYDQPVFWMYMNWELLNDTLWYPNNLFSFSNDSKDIYYYWYSGVNNEEKFFKNNEEISYFPYFADLKNWLQIFEKYLWFKSQYSNFSFFYNNKEYETDYKIVYLFPDDWTKNVKFIWKKSDKKTYSVSCSLNSNLNLNTTYKLSQNEIQVINLLWDKINIMTEVKRNEYKTLLNKYYQKFDETTKQYEIINQSNTIKISTADLASGVYYIIIKAEDKSYLLKVVKL